MHWVLVIFMTSPGGDFVAKQELVMPNKVRCYRAAADLKGARDIMGIRYQATCVQRDAQGLNVGDKPLD